MENGISTLRSKHAVGEVLTRLLNLLREKGVTVFAVVDHSGEAEKAGMRMPDTKLIVFGNPKAGTPLMLAAPSIALDLPLKILIREEAGGGSVVSYNDAEFLRKRHGLAEGLGGAMEGVKGIVLGIVE